MTALMLALCVTVYAYSPAPGTLNCDGDCSVTSSGLAPSAGMAACGYGWALGDVLAVDGYGLVVCADRFGARVGPHDVDLLMPSRQDALAWGVQRSAVRHIGRCADIRACLEMLEGA